MPPRGPGIDGILARAAGIEGLLAAALVEVSSGQVLAQLQVGDAVAPDLVAAAAADVAAVLGDLVTRAGLDDELEDVMVTLTGRQFLMRGVRDAGPEPLVLVVTLDRREATLGLARRDLREIAGALGRDRVDG